MGNKEVKLSHLLRGERGEKAKSCLQSEGLRSLPQPRVLPFLVFTVCCKFREAQKIIKIGNEMNEAIGTSFVPAYLLVLDAFCRGAMSV